ncbi:hypothetical protein E2C01_022137 [Portunus trituberculatus]|uniref:Uncharacterized protein n=1 Tax=Portunus trituberculatus TaxID=210409 RepID=A0A5B7E4F7_PORTR|nr:hypothetical protein [Portunus trituberculatus]
MKQQPTTRIWNLSASLPGQPCLLQAQLTHLHVISACNERRVWEKGNAGMVYEKVGAWCLNVSKRKVKRCYGVYVPAIS